ncbi:hypothetical protein PSTT_15683 [Puccinia striiformis]|uniref:Transcription factor IIIC subunit 5 HTH domain-containing protein n=1 Tax=Puccinia striiformis TaxID=27350 RepID=A0A2S4UGH7_9BASI|nr:hypothetical protein PSTT_15683 [Puccinia striiformis]
MGSSRNTQQLAGVAELVGIECPVRLKKQKNGQEEEGGRYDGLVERLGGLNRLSTQLVEKDPNRPIELTLVKPSTDNTFISPVSGEWVQTSNILIKIIKRTRRRKRSAVDDDLRLYTIEPVGVIPMTVRFRALADYQYTPDLKHPINILAQDMRSLNCEGVLKFSFEPETEDYSSSKIGLFPPPLISRYLVPQQYNYRQNVPTVVTLAPDGTERLINKAKYVPMGPQTITFDQPDVPGAALARDIDQKKPENLPLFEKLDSLFEQRPIWSRMAFHHQLTPTDLRYIRQNKVVLALYCYLFSDGPFRDLLIKFGYDPRTNSESRFFQRISLRNVDRKEAKDKFTLKLMKRDNSKNDSAEMVTSDTLRDHIFDGKELHQSVGTYQLCDISDPLLVTLINSSKGVLNECDYRTGWYTSNGIEQIRSILRRKFHGLLDEQRVIKDIECVDLLEIDIGHDAIDLLKKRPKNAAGSSRQELITPTLDSDPPMDTVQKSGRSSRNRKSATKVKPNPPNPLLKLRREKKRVKAKAVDKTVRFDPPMVPTQGPSSRTAKTASSSTTKFTMINTSNVGESGKDASVVEDDQDDDPEEEDEDEDDFFREKDNDDDDEEEEEAADEDEEDDDDDDDNDDNNNNDDDDDPLQEDQSSSLSDLSD